MTTRRLLVIRHAEAEGGLPDERRELAPDGRRDAEQVGRWLREQGLVPDAVVVSPATRALQTWERAMTRIGRDVPTSTDGRIYDNTVESLLAVIREQDDATRTLAVVGHNPSVHGLAVHLTGPSEDLAHYPTATVTVIEVGTTWLDITGGTVRSVTTCRA